MKNIFFSKKNALIFILFSAFHLFVFLADFYIDHPNKDWVVQWNAIQELLNGRSFYELDNGSPQHFPIFFYTISLFLLVYGTSEVMGKIFLWFSTIILFFLIWDITEPTNEKREQTIIIIYFLNPMLIGNNFLGLFDQFASIFMLAGVVLILKERPGWAGIVLAFGTMTKLFPIFVVISGSILLFREKRFQELIKLNLSCILILLLIFIFHLLTVGTVFVEKTIEWQFNRPPNVSNWNLSFWKFILPAEQSSFTFLPIQILVFISVLIFLLKINISLKDRTNFLLVSSSLIIITFLVLLRTNLPQYSLWHFFLLVPIFADIICDSEKIKYLIPYISGLFLFYVGIILSYVIPTIFGIFLSPFLFVGALLVGVAHIFFVIQIYILMKFIKNNNSRSHFSISNRKTTASQSVRFNSG